VNSRVASHDANYCRIVITFFFFFFFCRNDKRRSAICEERNGNEERQNGRGGRGDMPCSGVENIPRVPRRWCDRYT
jgi:hypothetical protein